MINPTKVKVAVTMSNGGSTCESTRLSWPLSGETGLKGFCLTPRWVLAWRGRSTPQSVSTPLRFAMFKGVLVFRFSSGERRSSSVSSPPRLLSSALFLSASFVKRHSDPPTAVAAGISCWLLIMYFHNDGCVVCSFFLSFSLSVSLL